MIAASRARPIECCGSPRDTSPNPQPPSGQPLGEPGPSALPPVPAPRRHWGMPTNRRDPTNEDRAATTIIVAADGSPSSQRALAWCAEHARRLGAERVIVVHAVHVPRYAPFVELGPVLTEPVMEARERERIRAIATEEWCRPLRNAAIDHDVLLFEGSAPMVLRVVAAQHDASLVV